MQGLTKDPSLAKVIETGIESYMLDVHTATAGTIESYDAKSQTCNIRLANKRILIDYNSGDTITKTYPILEDVPVGTIGGGGITFTIPLEKGDSVLVIFTEDDISNYRYSGKPDSSPSMLDRHSLHGAVALPVQIPRRQTSTTSSSFTIGSGASAEFVALANLVMQNFNKLKAAIESHVHTGVLTGPGVSGAASPAPGVIPVTISDVASKKLKTE